METSATTLVGIALNFAGGNVPDWIQLTPPGPQIAGRDGRSWRLSNPEAVALAFRQGGTDLPVDVEHATQLKAPQGDPAPAAGWIKHVEVRDGALWGRVEWTEDGASAIASRGYRYVSPAFRHRSDTGEVVSLVSAGLTNKPNFQMAALNNEGGEKETDLMDKAVLEALGLAPNATAADAVVAINSLKEAERVALNAAQTPDTSKFVPRADYDVAINRVKEFEAAEKDREDEAINSAVDAAIEGGKIAPASRDYHIAACRAEGGLEAFNAMVDGLPELAGKGKLDGKTPPNGAPKLDADALSVCRQMGITAEEYAEIIAKEENN